MKGVVSKQKRAKTPQEQAEIDEVLALMDEGLKEALKGNTIRVR